MKNKITKTPELKPDPSNPNRLSASDKKRMARSLDEFGDLSGVILNRRTGMLVGGHQRADVLAGAEVQTEELQDAEQDGTVARGWLVKDGKRYALRVVDWDETKAHAALLAANRFGRIGKDDDAALRALLEGLEAEGFDLELAGYTANDLNNHNEGKPTTLDPVYEIIITCRDEAHMEEIYSDLLKREIKCRLSTL